VIIDIRRRPERPLHDQGRVCCGATGKITTINGCVDIRAVDAARYAFGPDAAAFLDQARERSRPQ